MDLKEMQFEMLPSIDDSEGFGFGIGLDVSVNADGFDPGGNEWVTQDGTSTTRGNTNFGRDLLTGPTWAWGLHTNMSDTKGALAALGIAHTAWKAPKIRGIAGAVLPLRYRVGDRTRRVYGRPRNFAAPPNNEILGGKVPITVDFKCVDDLHYDDLEQTSVIGSSSGSTGNTGFLLPAVFPVLTLNPDEQQQRPGAIFVEGDAAAYPIIRFDGPCVRPWVQLDQEGWRASLDVTLGNGEYAIIDTRPWVSSAVLNGDRFIGGALGRRQWLADMTLTPGNHLFTFGGDVTTGSSRCTVSWRNAWNSL